MKIRFLGAVGTVTGSKFLVSTDTTEVMIDCGLFQGLKELRLKNWRKVPVDVSRLNGVVLTHAHIDHSGYIPAFVRDGFRGDIFCTEPTRDLCGLLLPDCGRINEEDAAFANEKGFSKHKPALPIYTEQDARRSLGQFRTMPLEHEFEIGDLQIRFHLAGHILGAAHVTVRHKGRSIVFSGDVGRYHDLLEKSPIPFAGGNWVVMETTYGNRDHSTVDPIQKIADIVQNTVERGGNVLIPSFAVGRTQTLLYCLAQAIEKGYMPKVPIFVNSPMATSATRLYQQHVDWHRLSEDECDKTCSIARFVSSVDESKGLNSRKGPMVVISASGMLTGGRVLHHLYQFGPDEKNTILLPGFQAAGTRGAALATGAKSVKVHGAQVPIKAEVIHLDMYSAHADRQELLRWLRELKQKPQKVFLVHGEPEARTAFAEELAGQFEFEIMMPDFDEEFELE